MNTINSNNSNTIDENRLRIHNYENSYNYGRGVLISQLNQNFESFSGRELEINGRINVIRNHSSVAFINITQENNVIQLLIRNNADLIRNLSNFQIGDVINVLGVTGQSSRGTNSIVLTSMNLLSPNYRNLAHTHFGYQDTEFVRGNREIAAISQPEILVNTINRSRLIRYIREYMYENQFLEVETPILQNNPSGAAALPFITHCNAINQDMYLRIAPELYLVRMINGGLNRIFELGRVFRNEGLSNRHHPEFTMMEAYSAYENFQFSMGFCENLVRQMVLHFHIDGILNYNGRELNFSNRFRVLSIREAVIEFGNVDNDSIDNNEYLINQIRRYNSQYIYNNESLEMLQYLLFENFENQLIQPTFIVGHPREISPLAFCRDGTNNTERFELFIYGREIANGFTQLLDPQEQVARFSRQGFNNETDNMREDTNYINSVSYGLPPVSGFGIGIDRLHMIINDIENIRDSIFFPI